MLAAGGDLQVPFTDTLATESEHDVGTGFNRRISS